MTWPRSSRVFPLVPILFALVACEAPKLSPATATLAPELPLADLHLHPRPGLSPSAIQEAMDANGVRWAGAGAVGGRRFIWVAASRQLGSRFIAFAGQTELNQAYFQGGVAAMEDAENPTVQAFLREAEEDLKAGRIKGIGEIFVNNSRSGEPASRRKARADAPSIRLLYQLVARHGAFLTFHMHADPDNVAQLEGLLASDRGGRILWNHCGSDTDARDVRPLLARHPNLFCELSFRYPPVLPAGAVRRTPQSKVFDEAGPDPGWLRLIEDFPDRFMLGTDAHSRSEYDGAIRVVRTGLLPYLSPSTARKVAYENAQRLFELR